MLLAGLCMARIAAADDPDALTTQGEDLARRGEFTRAIELLKQADGIQATAKHACLIGLVYTRRELWSQAEIFLDRCRARASPSDPVPDWFAQATAQLAKKLREVDVEAVEIRVEPAEVAAIATLPVSSFAPDETFGPRTIHLTPGRTRSSRRRPGTGHGPGR